MSTRLFVANIPFTATEDDLHALFSEYKLAVSEVRIITDRDTQRSRGYGFVEMRSADDAKVAIAEMNEQAVLGDRTLAVRVADPRPDRGAPPRKTRSSDW